MSRSAAYVDRLPFPRRLRDPHLDDPRAAVRQQQVDLAGLPGCDRKPELDADELVPAPTEQLLRRRVAVPHDPGRVDDHDRVRHGRHEVPQHLVSGELDRARRPTRLARSARRHV